MQTRDDNRTAVAALHPQLASVIAHNLYACRKARQFSQRQLSQQCGISQRYIAQIEAGDANISIQLLERIAAALGCDVLTLLGAGDGPRTPDAERKIARTGTSAGDGGARLRLLAALFTAAPTPVQDRVLSQLRAASPQAGRPKTHIALIGLRGAGKSTLGRIVCTQLGLSMIEGNDYIRDHTGMAISELIELYGHEGYRRREQAMLEHISKQTAPVIVAVSGGIVSDEDSYSWLLDCFHVIWIRAEPEDHMARVRAQGDDRPMAGHADAMAELRALLARREADYARAPHCIDSSARNLGETARQLCGLVQSLLKTQ